MSTRVLGPVVIHVTRQPGATSQPGVLPGLSTGVPAPPSRSQIPGPGGRACSVAQRACSTAGLANCHQMFNNHTTPTLSIGQGGKDWRQPHIHPARSPRSHPSCVEGRVTQRGASPTTSRVAHTEERQRCRVRHREGVNTTTRIVGPLIAYAQHPPLAE